MKHIYTFLCLFLLSGVASAETPFSLLRAGYDILYEGYGVVEECVPEKPIVLGSYIVVCSSYSYPYHYGEVFLFSKYLTYEGRNYLIGYLCLGEDDDDCEDLDRIYRR